MLRQRDIFLFTSAAPTVTLFSQNLDRSRRPTSLLASVVIHAAVATLVFYGILTAPATTRVTTEHFNVRQLELRTPDQEKAARSRSSAAARALAKALPGSGGSPQAPRQAIHAAAGPQTLLQADIPVQIALTEKIPVPRVVIWTPSKTVAQKIVGPQPSPPTKSETRPSTDSPNSELELSDLSVATTEVTNPKLPIPSGSTTPVVSHAQSQVQLPPATTTQNTAQPTPASVLSLSDLQMKAGPVTLPPVNEAVHNSDSGTITNSGEQNQEGPGGNGRGTGGETAGKQTGSLPSGSEGGDRGHNGPTPGAGTDNGQSNSASTTQITLPKDGRFGSVVVGESVTDQYPEMADVWSGRMAYTVFLHVGLTRSWILQYSLPRDDDAATAGNASRLDAPWPYTIVRPNLTASEINADALMVHGYVDQSGHFENLSMVFPQPCSQAEFVLKSLDKWQFRPAARNGQTARVEILLIIPEDLE